MTETMVASPDGPDDTAETNRIDREALIRNLAAVDRTKLVEGGPVRAERTFAAFGFKVTFDPQVTAEQIEAFERHLKRSAIFDRKIYIAEHHRQPAYDAVYQVIAALPCRSEGDYNQAAENGRIWRAVEAALDAMGVPK